MVVKSSTPPHAVYIHGSPVAMAKAIVRLEQDRTLGKQMGLAGRQYVEKHFDRSIIAANMLDVMKDLVEEKR